MSKVRGLDAGKKQATCVFRCTFQEHEPPNAKHALELVSEDYWECRGMASYLGKKRGWVLLSIERIK